MALADWIHKYPRVQALLQQEEDRLLGASIEEAPGVTVDPREALADLRAHVARLRQETLRAHRWRALVAVPIYTALRQWATTLCGGMPYTRDGQFMLYGVELYPAAGLHVHPDDLPWRFERLT